MEARRNKEDISSIDIEARILSYRERIIQEALEAAREIDRLKQDEENKKRQNLLDEEENRLKKLMEQEEEERKKIEREQPIHPKVKEAEIEHQQRMKINEEISKREGVEGDENKENVIEEHKEEKPSKEENEPM